MLTTPEKFRLPTTNACTASLVVNWNERARGEFVKLTVNGEEAIIPRAIFVRAALIIGSDDEQNDLIPVKQIRIRQYKKDVVLRLKRDMKQGEFIKTTVSIDLPYDDTVPKSGLILT